MKHIVSVSLGSSTRNHSVEVDLMGRCFKIERIGTDGSMEKAINLIRELDGTVDAFGLGGIDLFIFAGDKRYVLRDAKRIADAAIKTPIVDGSGLKNTLERMVIQNLIEVGMEFEGMRTLMVCGADRFGLAQSLTEAGAKVIFGDLIFTLGIPIPINSLRTLNRAIQALAPIACNLPFKMLYPTGEKQETFTSKHERFFRNVELIAGDFHYIRRYAPENLEGKTIITNTITAADIELLKERGLSRLITTTPEIQGRSFGTNVMEGLLVSLLGDLPEESRKEQYPNILKELEFKPRIIEFEAKQQIV